jgi:hypothetical protein
MGMLTTPTTMGGCRAWYTFLVERQRNLQREDHHGRAFIDWAGYDRLHRERTVAALSHRHHWGTIPSQQSYDGMDRQYGYRAYHAPPDCPHNTELLSAWKHAANKQNHLFDDILSGGIDTTRIHEADREAAPPGAEVPKTSVSINAFGTRGYVTHIVCAPGTALVAIVCER